MPFISEVSPTAVAPGGPDFTLTVLGTGFINGQSAIYWNGAALPDPTTCTTANSPQPAFCTVTVRATMIATSATANVTVVNPTTAPATGTSNVAFIPISTPTPNFATTERDFSMDTDQNSLVAEGDFNGDGKPDLVVLGSSLIPCAPIQPCPPISVLITMLGDGAGNFTNVATTQPLGFNPGSIAVGDFNGDGKLDLALISPAPPCRASCATTPTVTPFILLGDGTGKFTAITPAPTGTLASAPSRWSMVVGDFNGDGNLDIATPDQTTVGNVAVFLGDGKAGFLASEISSGSSSPAYLLASGDFNGDGVLDLAVHSLPSFVCLTCTLGNESLAILLGDGTGKFTAGPAPISLEGTNSAIAVGDFNGDGTLDLALANSCTNNPDCQGGSVSILLGDGTGNFIPSTTISNLPQGASTMLMGDFNGDGKLDLALGENPLTVLLGDGSGKFVPNPAVLASSRAGNAMAVGDFNGDGRLDLALASSHIGVEAIGTNSSNDGIVVLLQTRGLVISKTHVGSFWPGQTGAVYSIVVTSTDGAPSSGNVTITDTLPSGLIATSLTGEGWDCSSNSFPVTGDGSLTLGCTRSDPLTAGTSYPPLTLSVNVATGIISLQANHASVSFVDLSGLTTNSTSDPTFISPFPDPSVTKSHVGDFVQGQTGATYTIAVGNAGPSLTGTITITDILPAGLITTDMSGTGWLCELATLSCTRNDGLGSGASDPPITVTVDVAASAPTFVTNRAQFSVSGGNFGATILASDRPTTINQPGPLARLSPSSLSFGSQVVGASGPVQVVTLLNKGNSVLSLAGIEVSSQFAETDNCGASLAPGAGCTLNVTFTPKAGGPQSGALTIADDAPGGSQMISLSGAGKDFALTPASGSSATASVTAGQSATFTLNIAPAGGFNQQVSFVCAGVPLKSTCTVSPASLNLNPVAPTTAIVQVTTTAGSMMEPQAPDRTPARTAPPQMRWLLPIFLAGILLTRATQARHRLPLRFTFGTALILFIMLGVFLMPGCGGTMAPKPVVHIAGPPTGTYFLTVTGTYAGASTTLSHSVQITLTVK